MINKFKNILKPKKNIAGLDIGSAYIKFMEIEGDTIDNIMIKNYAIEPIPRDLIGDNGVYPNPEEIANLIRKCWKKSGSDVTTVAISLSSSGTIYKKITAPALELESEQQLQMEGEVTKFLPEDLSLNNISMDYYTMNKKGEDADVLLVAAKKEKIEDRVALVEAAGLEPVIMDVDIFAYQNMLRLMKGEDFMRGIYVVLDCSGLYLRLLVFKRGELFYYKDASVGGVHLTQDIANNLSISYSESEKIKIERSGDETYDMIEKQFMNNYMTELARTFTYFTSATSMSDIDEIILTGGMSCVPGIEEAVKNILIESGENYGKVDPYIAKPLDDVEKNTRISMNKFKRDEPGLFLVSSLALRKFLRDY